MKYAIIADVHANLKALEAVLRDIEDQKCEHIACLGDIVGYGRNPKECLDIIRSKTTACLKGNHDEYCAAETTPEGLTAQAADNLRWTHDQLTAEDRKWLRELPHSLVLSGFTIVHATLNEPHRWGYVFDRIAAAESFERQTTPVCFFGHTHVPVAFILRDTVVKGGTYSKFKVDPGRKYFVNVGSVGQPRDNNPKAAYAIYDLEKSSVELRRVNYPQSDSGNREGGEAPAPVTKPPVGGPPFLSGANQMESG